MKLSKLASSCSMLMKIPSPCRKIQHPNVIGKSLFPFGRASDGRPSVAARIANHWDEIEEARLPVAASGALCNKDSQEAPI